MEPLIQTSSYYEYLIKELVVNTAAGSVTSLHHRFMVTGISNAVLLCCPVPLFVRNLVSMPNSWGYFCFCAIKMYASISQQEQSLGLRTGMRGL